jgi:hypothetical protein
MSEVDWVLRRVGGELDELRSEVAELRERLALTEAAEAAEAIEPEKR